MARKKIKLGAFLSGTGSHGAGWRHPDGDADSGRNVSAYVRVAQKLEAGLFDTVFLNDSVYVRDGSEKELAHGAQGMRWDPLTLLPALAMVTDHIGLVATANTTYNDPYTLARRFASLDHLSDGRAGWNLVTSLGGAENYGREEHLLHARRYERAEEFLDVVTGLWDSWEDDAFVQDKESGRWVDLGKRHVLNHKGAHFSVRGPLNAARPVQGHPVIAQAGSSEDGRNLAAKGAELIFTAAHTIEEGVAFRKDIERRLHANGRTIDDVVILPGVAIYLADTADEARAYYRSLQKLSDPQITLKSLSRYVNVGVDLWTLPLSSRISLPDTLPETNTHKSRQKLIWDFIRRENPTVEDLLYTVTTGGHRVLFGSPLDIADDLEAWFTAGAADGFNIMFPCLPTSVDRFVDQVVPELQRRGLFRTTYEGTTLREKLGLPRPENRLAGAQPGQSGILSELR